jgi:hypothetical protein
VTLLDADSGLCYTCFCRYRSVTYVFHKLIWVVANFRHCNDLRVYLRFTGVKCNGCVILGGVGVWGCHVLKFKIQDKLLRVTDEVR